MIEIKFPVRTIVLYAIMTLWLNRRMFEDARYYTFIQYWKRVIIHFFSKCHFSKLDKKIEVKWNEIMYTYLIVIIISCYCKTGYVTTRLSFKLKYGTCSLCCFHRYCTFFNYNFGLSWYFSYTSSCSLQVSQISCSTLKECEYHTYKGIRIFIFVNYLYAIVNQINIDNV